MWYLTQIFSFQTSQKQRQSKVKHIGAMDHGCIFKYSLVESDVFW